MQPGWREKNGDRGRRRAALDTVKPGFVPPGAFILVIRGGGVLECTQRTRYVFLSFWCQGFSLNSFLPLTSALYVGKIQDICAYWAPAVCHMLGLLVLSPNFFTHLRSDAPGSSVLWPCFIAGEQGS